MAKKGNPQKQEPGKGGNPNPNPATRFQPGQSGNPGGKPVGARNALTRQFLEALAADFEEHGKKALETVRDEDPAAYIRVIASIVPKEITVDRPLDGLTDEELAAAIEVARERLEQVKKAQEPETRH